MEQSYSRPANASIEISFDAALKRYYTYRPMSPKHLSAIDELNALKAEYAKRESAIKDKALAELHHQLKAAEAEVNRIKDEISQLSGHAAKAHHAVESKPKGKRLKPIEEGSEEWNKVAKQIGIVLKNYPQGLNGKELAYKLGLTTPSEIRRVKPVIEAAAVREGAGVATRYFVKN